MTSLHLFAQTIKNHRTSPYQRLVSNKHPSFDRVLSWQGESHTQRANLWGLNATIQDLWTSSSTCFSNRTLIRQPFQYWHTLPYRSVTVVSMRSGIRLYIRLASCSGHDQKPWSSNGIRIRQHGPFYLTVFSQTTFCLLNWPLLYFPR